MEILYFGYFVSFCLGAILTSFLQVAAVEFGNWYVRNEVYEAKSEAKCVYKWLRNNWNFFVSKLNRRSHCDACKQTLTVWQLVPIVSLLASWGKCTTCGTKISWKYLWAELAGAFVLAGLYYYFVTAGLYLNEYAVGLAMLLVLLFMFAIAIVFVDLEHMLIPNILVYPFVFISMLFAVTLNWNTEAFVETFLYSVAAGISFFAIIWTMWAYSKGKWIGFADAKLVLAVGLILGFSAGFTALAFACWAGAIVGLALIAFENIQSNALPDEAEEITIKSAIPFGPFILFGLWTALITGWNMFSLAI